MPLPKTGFYTIVAQNETAVDHVTLPPIVIPPNTDIRAHVMVTHVGHTGQGSGWGTSVYISQYVQGGQIHTGQFAFLFGNNITEIILRADVSSSDVWGLLLLEYF